MTSQLATANFILARGVFDGLRSFSELEERISALGEENTKILGDAFEIFIEGLLATQQKFLVDQNWVVGQVPLDVRQEMNLPADTKGIDGIFRTRTGALVPYQVKFRSGRPTLTYTEVAPFLGLTERAEDRIIFTNCNDVAPDAKNRDAMRTVRGTDLDDLTADDFAAIEGWLKKRPAPAPLITPRRYQKEAIEGICSTLSEHDRATAAMACGTGKTLVALWAVEKLQPKTVLVLLPSLTLVQQTLEEWSRHNSWGEGFSFICVCSDPTVARNDDIELHRMDLDFPVSTQPDDVRKFLERQSCGVKVVFSTYQSSPIVSEGAKGLRPFDVGVFDEAHKTTGPKAGLFAHSLFDENVAITKRLFLTATPRHYQIGKRDTEGDLKVVSMDDENAYGPRAYTLTFGEAARRGIICDYKVIISVVDGGEIDQFLLQHGITLVEGEQIGTSWVANQIALQRAVEETSAKRAISFHSRVSMAQDFGSDTSRGIGRYLEGFRTFHASGKQKSSERKQILRAFRDAPKAVITNARCLTEGIDIPAVDMVAFIDPRRSQVDIAQAAGRAMRKPHKSDKITGFVVVPLFVERDAGESFEEALERTNYGEVIAVLNAMREQDDDLVEIIQHLKEAKGRGELFNPKPLLDKVQLLGPSVSLETLQSSVFAEVVESLGESWDEWFGRLQAYKEEHGDCLVAAKYKTRDGHRLGSWVDKQRQRDKSLSAERREALDGLGFVWDPHEQAWEVGFRALQKYKEDNGDCLVPAKHKAEDGFGLGGWVRTQRLNKHSLSLERQARLDAIDFSWEPRADTWEIGFRALKSFAEEHGHVSVPTGHISPDGVKLFTWVTNQRSRKHLLSAGRRKLLESLGFTWNPRDEHWVAGLKSLRSYNLEKGDCRVPKDYVDPEGFKLGSWVSTQRVNRKSLDADRYAQLEALGFVWNVSDAVWEDGFGALKLFREEYGHCRVPKDYIDLAGFKLGVWVSTQRRRPKILTRSREQRLDQLGFQWDPKGDDWRNWIRALTDYQEEFGDCLIPYDFQTNSGLRLGAWVSHQRSKRTSLSTDQRLELDTIGFEWDPVAAAWEEGLAKLKSYKEKNGDTRVPQTYKTFDGFPLGIWVNSQRQKRELLSAKRLRKLDAIGFVWEPRIDSWRQGFVELQHYKEKHGDCLIPAKYRTLDGFRLGSWVDTQRQRSESMPSDRRQLLEDIGFVWDPLARAWDEGFAALKAYKSKHGNMLVPAKYSDENGYALGRWVNRQRVQRKTISSERRDKLDAVGFVWDVKAEGWEVAFKALEQYKEQHGDCRVPQTFRTNEGLNLGSWVSNQRSNREKLDEDKRVRLDAIGFVWKVR